MTYLPVTVLPAIVIADNRDSVDPNSRPNPYPSISRYLQIEQERTQQRLNQLAPKAVTDPDAVRQYRELSDQNTRKVQVLTDPTK